MKYSLQDVNIKLSRYIPKEIAKELNIIPIKEELGSIYIGCVKETSEINNYLKLIYEKDIKIILLNKDNIRELIESVYSGFSNNINNDTVIETTTGLVNNIIEQSIKQEASDIHLEPMASNSIIRIRVDGKLYLMAKIDNNQYLAACTRIKLISNIDITEKRKPQDGKISFKYQDRSYDLRVSSIPTIYGEKIVIRILYNESFNLDINSLSFPREQLEIIKRLIALRHGIVLVCGPTGSGKSTTLYSIIKTLNINNLNITTVEDPVEVYLDGINQINVNIKAGITFSSGLRSILRQDPDVIMIGEIRDEETAKIAIRSSITGHKVYSTIHTNSALEVFTRLYDMGVEKYLVKDAIKGIISQRLVRKLCDNCKESYVISSEQIEKYGIKIGSRLSRSVGCSKCNYTGFKGRTLVSEVLVIDDKLKAFSGESDSIYNSSTSNNGLIKICRSLLLDGRISFEEYVDFVEGEAF
ncbi:general secretion pathway protein GspE [Clostridium polyendosporum]|uniref:General secretion pathway protein GspE n=1 Tax=Clostridium polyendosporum TaxID=69208 RepID=A0A919RX36_9CLOT|nr:GspE/PulE family protein [Clostridium polyendosporum]GIM27966.1 general secretion pathway protein GspE [Clostridium polyendosporum]